MPVRPRADTMTECLFCMHECTVSAMMFMPAGLSVSTGLLRSNSPVLAVTVAVTVVSRVTFREYP